MVHGANGDDKIRWGILATGGIAATFTEALLTLPDAEVAAVASRSIGSAETFADRYGIPRAYGSWAELAQDDSLDVVYVATPHSAHRAAAGLCLEAGRAVLCEKAFTVNSREAGELTVLAADRRSFLMEAMWMYCNPLILRMLDLVRDGAIGDIRAIHADFGIAGPFTADHRLRDPALAGGALLDLGVYPVSFAHLLLGEPDTVQATAHLTPEGVDDTTGIVLGWDGGALALLSCSISSDAPVTASVTGTTGRIEIPHGFFYPDRFTLHRSGHDPEEFRLADVTAVPERDSLRHEAAEVMRCLRAGETESPLVPLAGSLAVMRTLDAVRERIGVRYPGE
ncbi:Gfo/Idh/MocA family oxidoreductase [Streptomyces sp. H10-C2]|uniref:Gfo/Idh/MocA family protein n=1 Tax=unclassified Streptomyces TaxID=2593676 RepID=UPI0024B993F0|nr:MULTISPECIES: Gfo/Idh/MocA family oxidoreductase [unclassified Streptomyces]MDJ0346566.1 Gfo/Idh/MocA family oxidoreductase [Streptomyces sp. PH10-H1]MDJ0374186.1 Gfo/Idh/MocA family oxidoreductase [Streptomyces sp. H10-C2]